MPDRYNNLNNTAPEVDPTKQHAPKVDKSDFDLSCCKYFKTIDGAIVPFDVFRVIPNSTYDIKYNIRAIMTNPYVKQLLSGKRAYVHVYHSNLSDLWEGADEMIKKGRNFSTQLSIPTLNKRVGVRQPGGAVLPFSTLTAGSPACYMGLPVENYDTSKSPIDNICPLDPALTNAHSITDYSNFDFSALPFVMYQQIYQAHYLNKNLVNSNSDWLPQVENHFILPLEASGHSVSKLSYNLSEAQDGVVESADDLFDFNSDYYVPDDVSDINPQNKSNKPFLNVLRFRQFKGDMFTSGSPFPDLLRGDVPVMSFNDLTGTIDWSDVLANTSSASNTMYIGYAQQSSHKVLTPMQSNGNPSNSSTNLADLKSVLDRAIVRVQGQITWNMNVLRALDVYTLLGERAARSDGTYDSFIKTMFGVSPSRHAHEPRYIGGFYLDFVNSTIEQTSETSSTPLGTLASRGITNGSGVIGKFSYNDHGYIMAVLDIVDETIYTGGVDRDWTDLTFDDQYLPLFNGLAPQYTRQQELVLTGVKADNEDVFNYVERFSHLKSRRNKALGQMSLPAYDINDNPIDLESCSYIHSRHFFTKQSFNNKFVTMTPKNIDMTPYTSTNDYPFLVTAECYNKAILPLPYITVPSGLTIMA